MSEERREPVSIDTTVTGNHGAGNYLTPPAGVSEIGPQVRDESRIWIEREDQPKQGMARKGHMKSARAAPDHPHVGRAEGSGQPQ